MQLFKTLLQLLLMYVIDNFRLQLSHLKCSFPVLLYGFLKTGLMITLVHTVRLDRTHIKIGLIHFLKFNNFIQICIEKESFDHFFFFF